MPPLGTSMAGSLVGDLCIGWPGAVLGTLASVLAKTVSASQLTLQMSSASGAAVPSDRPLASRGFVKETR